LSILDRYILREWLKILGLLLGATVGLLLIQRLYDDCKDLIEVGAGPLDLAMYYLAAVPGFLPVVLPLAILISLLYCLGQLHRNNEFTAMRAAGLGLFRLTRGIWAVGILACALTCYLNAHVVPWSAAETERIWDSLKFRQEAKVMGSERVGLVRSVTFDNQRQGRFWYINRYGRFAQCAYGVTVSELDRHRRELRRIEAREGRYDAAGHGWTFRNGRELVFDEDGEIASSSAFAEKTFARFTEDPRLMLLIDRRPVDLSFAELSRVVGYYRAEDNPKATLYAVRYYGLIADTFGSLIVIAIAIPFAVSGVRVSPAVGVSKSIGLFFLYYLLVNLANMLGGRALIDPVLAAALPNLTMAGVGGWLFWRLR
jgi:lipopolysaccharide export system permease protein